MSRSWMTTGILLLLAGTVWAEGPGTSGAQILTQNTGIQGAGMASARAAGSGSLEALSFNPAGLANLPAGEIKLMHAGGVEGLATEWLGAAAPASGLGTLAAQVSYRSAPPIDNQVPSEAAVSWRDIIFGIGLAGQWTKELSMGFGAKVFVLTLGSAEASGLALDLGGQYRLTPELNLGLALKNFGTGVKFLTYEDPLPFSITAGSEYRLWTEAKQSLLAELDFEYQAVDQIGVVRLGAEYASGKTFSARAGYAYQTVKSVSGPSFGVTLGLPIKQTLLTLDYAATSQVWSAGDFELENLLSLGLKF
jgi:hypothetical protein